MEPEKNSWLDTAELIAGGIIDELARAAREHGVVITIAFLPDDANEDAEADE